MGKALTITPQVLTLLRRFNYCCADMERWFPSPAGGKHRHDFPYPKNHGGFADVLAWLEPDLRASILAPVDGYNLQGVLAIQGCTSGNLQAHYNKIVYGEPYVDVRRWLNAGNRLELWAFPRSSQKKRTEGKNNQLRMKSYRFSFDQELLWEEGTELEALGYVYGRRRQ